MFDVVIIGAGSAGLAAQKEVSKMTQNYLVITDEPLGTTCARVGCMPSKILIEAANIYHQNYKFEQLGVMGAENLQINHQRLMEHVRSLRDRFVNHVIKDIHKWSEKNLLIGRAKILDKETLEVGAQKIRFKKLIVATGSTPVIPSQWSELKNQVYTNENFFDIDRMPKRLAVIGAGPMGLEIAQALARLDVEVFLFAESQALGGVTDPDLLGFVQEQLEKQLFYIPRKVSVLKRDANGFCVETSESSHKVDGVFLALGRKANVQNLGLENLNIKIDKEGLPTVNKQTMRVAGTNVYFAGDVSSHTPVLHEAVDEGRIAGYNATRDIDEDFERRTPLLITYSWPEIAMVGKNFKELVKAKIDFQVGEASFEKQGRALARMDNIGGLRVYGDSETGEILGAEFFCPGAEHLAHLVAWAVEEKNTVFDILGKPFYHPVLEEGLRSALRSLAKKVPGKCSDFDLARCADMPVGS